MYYKFIKFAISIFLLISSINSKDISNSIILTINGEPITEYDIKKQEKLLKNITGKKQSKKSVIDNIITSTLIKNEIKKINAKITDDMIKKQIEYMASKNGMTKNKFLAQVTKKGININDYKNSMRLELERSTLMRYITYTKADIINRDDVKNYYNSNIYAFRTASKYDVTMYASNNRASLSEFINDPMMVDTKGLMVKDLSINASQIPKNSINIFNATNINSYTPIIKNNNNGMFQTFKIVKKYDEKIVTQKEATKKIKQILIRQNSMSIVNEYFFKMRNNAKIEYIN